MRDPQKEEAKRQRQNQDLMNKFTFQEIHMSRWKNYKTWTLMDRDPVYHILESPTFQELS